MNPLEFDKSFLRKLEQMSLMLKRLKPGRSQGVRRSPKKGNSVEFADFRNYTRGDDLRRVDWNAYARLNKMFLKLFVEEQDATLYMLIDRSRSMTFGDGSKYRFALQVAAALCYVALESYDRAGVGLISSKLDDFIGPVSGRSSWMRIWEFLRSKAVLDETLQTDLLSSVKGFCSRRPLPGLTVLITDLFTDGYQDAVRALQAAGQEVVVLHLLSAEEISPEASGEVRVIDSETGSFREVSITPALLRGYRLKFEQFCDSARRFCVSRGITYLKVRSDESVEEFVVYGLLAAGLLQ